MSDERPDPGHIVEGDQGEAYDMTKLTAIVEDRITRYPDQVEMQRWVEEHPGVNVRPVEGIEGAFTMLLYDQENDVEFVFGEFHRDDLLA